MQEENFETLREYRVQGRNTKDEHDHYQFTAPAEKGQMAVDIFLSEEGGHSRLQISQSTNVHYEPLFNVLEVFYPVRPSHEIWASTSEGYERRKPSSDWGDESLNVFELYREGEQWDFDLEWRDMSHNRPENDPVPFDFDLTVYDGFGPNMDRGSFDPIEKILPVMMRDDAPADSRGAMLRDVMRLLGEEPEKDTVSASNYFEPELIDAYIEDTASRFDPYR